MRWSSVGDTEIRPNMALCFVVDLTAFPACFPCWWVTSFWKNDNMSLGSRPVSLDPGASASGFGVTGSVSPATSGIVHLVLSQKILTQHTWGTIPDTDMSCVWYRAFQRRVRKEWESLQAGLPSTIWVRAYESR